VERRKAENAARWHEEGVKHYHKCKSELQLASLSWLAKDGGHG
jgi:exonuclease VII small subunit